MTVLTLKQLTQSLAGKTVLVREDFNVPLDVTGAITDDTRIQEGMETIQYLVAQQAKVVILCHFGRPKGQVVDSMRLAPVAQRLSELLGQAVLYSPNSLENYEAFVASVQPGQVALVENTRFLPGEEKNDPELAKRFATGIDVFVNDAFGAAHRAHASTEGVAHSVPVAVAGFLMAREIEALTPLVPGMGQGPKQPFTAIIGGSKVSTKITVLENLLNTVQHLIIGGGMTHTFNLALGGQVGNSLVEKEHVPTALRLLEQAKAKGVAVHLTSDVVMAQRIAADAETKLGDSKTIPDGWEGLDAGPETLKAWEAVIAQSNTILWNGPVGVFEVAPFAAGTRRIAELLAQATQRGATTVLGGGDTVAAIGQFGMNPNAFTHVSTGGGASLEFLEGQVLPGIAALNPAPTLVAAG
ncbi:MAG: phosphoglycerate kinase [Vampirovibrionales bacterium]|nr:phosphoglycerate kinase [Vampirovibrionales bacterium]